MTPKQIGGYFSLAKRRVQLEHADALSIATIAGRAEPREIKAQIKELTDEN